MLYRYKILIIILCTFLLAACGGGSNTTSTTPPVFDSYSGTSVVRNPEAPAVTDSASTYAVETQGAVIHAAITTVNGTYTFDQVNSDIDPDDAFEPEVAAHVIADNYADDGLATNATLRLRGSTSRLAIQKSYRLKLAKTVAKWRGETTLQLNKHPWDLTRVRNKLAFDLFRDIPHLPSLRTQFMHVTINGQDYGLFTHVEKMGKEYLANRGLPTDGTIYKANHFTFRMENELALDATGKPVDTAAFEKILELENDNGDHTPLLRMISAVNDETKSINDVIGTYFDRNNYIAWLAVNILVGNLDTLTQNFALYQPKGTSTFYLLPWDYDGAFGIENQPDIKAENNLYAPWQLGVGNWWDIPLHQRFLKDAHNRSDLIRTIKELRSTYLNTARIQAKLDAYRPLVQPFIHNSPDSDNLPTISGDRSAEWATEYARLATTIESNYQRFIASLEQPMPFWQNYTVTGNSILLEWDDAVDLQGNAVTYLIELASDPNITTITYRKENHAGISITIPKPATGTYYLRITAYDTQGNSTNAFDRFDLNNKAYFGVLSCTVP